MSNSHVEWRSAEKISTGQCQGMNAILQCHDSLKNVISENFGNFLKGKVIYFIVKIAQQWSMQMKICNFIGRTGQRVSKFGLGKKSLQKQVLSLAVELIWNGICPIAPNQVLQAIRPIRWYISAIHTSRSRVVAGHRMGKWENGSQHFGNHSASSLDQRKSSSFSSALVSEKSYSLDDSSASALLHKLIIAEARAGWGQQAFPPTANLNAVTFLVFLVVYGNWTAV